MTDITFQRLHRQRIAQQQFDNPADVVRWMGAMQAQDYLGALWSVGLRTKIATEASIEQAIADRTIIRTWPMRGTLHFVAPDDARWMLALLTPRIVAKSAARYRQLELNDTVFEQSKTIIITTLNGGKQLTRPEIFAILERSNISTKGQRGIHILSHLAQETVICFGPRSAKQPTFVLMDEWVPAAKHLDRDEALAEIAKRYFTSHGPSTLQDFIWWTGLKVSDAKAGLDAVASELAQETIDGKTYWFAADTPAAKNPESSMFLLPGFDEYMLGYTDRSAALDSQHKQKIHPGGNGIFSSTIILDGKVVGTWKRTIKKSTVVMEAEFFHEANAKEKDAFAAAAQHYGDFLSLSVVLP